MSYIKRFLERELDIMDCMDDQFTIKQEKNKENPRKMTHEEFIKLINTENKNDE